MSNTFKRISITVGKDSFEGTYVDMVEFEQVKQAEQRFLDALIAIEKVKVGKDEVLQVREGAHDEKG